VRHCRARCTRAIVGERSLNLTTQEAFGSEDHVKLVAGDFKPKSALHEPEEDCAGLGKLGLVLRAQVCPGMAASLWHPVRACCRPPASFLTSHSYAAQISPMLSVRLGIDDVLHFISCESAAAKEELS